MKEFAVIRFIDMKYETKKSAVNLSNQLSGVFNLNTNCYRLVANYQSIF